MRGDPFLPVTMLPADPSSCAMPPPAARGGDVRERGLLIPAVLAAGILATSLLSWGSFEHSRRERDRPVPPTADLVAIALRTKLAETESVLRGLAGLQVASDQVSLPELQRFARSLESDGASLEVIGTLGYAASGSGETPIRLVTPVDTRGRRLLGRDIRSTIQGHGEPPGIRNASPLPRGGWLFPGVPAPGESPFLVQAVPLARAASGEEAQAPPGWAFATLPIQNLLRAALNTPLLRLRGAVDLQLFAGDRADRDHLLYDSRNLPRADLLSQAAARRLETGGQSWLLLVQEASRSSEPRVPPWVTILLVGLGATSAVALLAHGLQRRNRSAVREIRALVGIRGKHEESLQQLRIDQEAFDLIQDGVVFTDRNGSILCCNEAYAAITGYSREELVGLNPRILQSGYQSREFYADLWNQLIDTGHWEGEIWNRRRTGEVYPAWVRMGMVRDACGEASHFVAAMSDLTRLQDKERQLEHVGYHDRLTNLPNLQMAELRLGQMCQLQQQLVVIWIEVDGIKRIEESFGQTQGDRMLQVVAERLKRFVGPMDLLARVGGVEFLLLHVVDPSDPTGLPLTRRILSGLKEPMDMGEGLELALSAWAGLSRFPESASAPEDLLQYAAMALGQARQLGPLSILSYAADMTTSSRRRLAIEAQLRRAVLEGDLELHYQPQMDGEGNLMGAEALVRWSSPEFGPIGPMEFLPIAEATDLIHQLGEWVLTEACRQWQSWVQAGLEPGLLAVNLSNRQFQDPRQTVPHMVKAALRRTGLAVGLLELEITESCLMPALGTREQILALDALGVKLAIDDFGTGYSSLSTMHSHPISKLKIDRSFVHEVDTNAAGQLIVRATLAMASGLGMTTLAEGVERPEELTFLQHCGCSAFQGYLFSRPVPAREFEAMLRCRTGETSAADSHPASSQRP